MEKLRDEAECGTASEEECEYVTPTNCSYFEKLPFCGGGILQEGLIEVIK